MRLTKRTKQIDSFESALLYVRNLGFTYTPGFAGWIPAAQKRMCDTIDAIESLLEKYKPNADGTVNTETFGKIDHYGYHVRYSRFERKFYVWDKWSPLGSPCSYTVDAYNL